MAEEQAESRTYPNKLNWILIWQASQESIHKWLNASGSKDEIMLDLTNNNRKGPQDRMLYFFAYLF